MRITRRCTRARLQNSNNRRRVARQQKRVEFIVVSPLSGGKREIWTSYNIHGTRLFTVRYLWICVRAAAQNVGETKIAQMIVWMHEKNAEATSARTRYCFCYTFWNKSCTARAAIYVRTFSFVRSLTRSLEGRANLAEGREKLASCLRWLFELF